MSLGINSAIFGMIQSGTDLFTSNESLPKLEQLHGKMQKNISLQSRYFSISAVFQILGDRNLANNVQINPFMAP